MLDLIVKSNKEKGAKFAEFDATACFNLQPPVFVVLRYNRASCVTHDENGCKVRAHETPEEDIESKGNLPAYTEHDREGEPQEEVNENEG